MSSIGSIEGQSRPNLAILEAAGSIYSSWKPGTQWKPKIVAQGAYVNRLAVGFYSIHVELAIQPDECLITVIPSGPFPLLAYLYAQAQHQSDVIKHVNIYRVSYPPPSSAHDFQPVSVDADWTFTLHRLILCGHEDCMTYPELARACRNSV